MPVLAISKFDEVSVKLVVPLPGRRLNIGYLCTQEGVTPSKMYNMVELDPVSIKNNDDTPRTISSNC